ncbi:tyrosine-type recombinase/integrase [Candidatus Poriferisodalis sp.]|uniref:tyrosine-type recombinase/integrase n=1 Tax=Candidatus Poriferisodalis sp. TaxID=3101277 RepID=UPI003AF9BC94
MVGDEICGAGSHRLQPANFGAPGSASTTTNTDEAGAVEATPRTIAAVKSAVHSARHAQTTASGAQADAAAGAGGSSTWPSSGTDGLTNSDAQLARRLAQRDIAEGTLRCYASQWRGFTQWAARRGVRALPADAAAVAAYLAQRLESHGHKPATLRVSAAAIAWVHAAHGLDSPCGHPDVRRTLKGAARTAGSAQKQANGLTADKLSLIIATARMPRTGRGGRPESARTARARGDLDIALASLMRDAMLRVSETAALTWDDLSTAPDRSGRLLIRRSKTDPTGEGAVVYVSPRTMALVALEPVRDSAQGRHSIFGLGRNQISNRIKNAARAAGLGEGYSGHSPRVGMAQDLARAGIELTSLMTAGRWRSPAMPALYTRNETAGRGAVAQFYAQRSPTA